MKLVPLFPDPETIAARNRWRRRARLASIAAGALVCATGGALVAIREFWPPATADLGTSALAQVHLARMGESLVAVRVVDSAGKAVAVTDRRGKIEPIGEVAPGTRLAVTATVHRSKWIGWLVGATVQVKAVTRAPATFLRTPLVYAAAGKAVRLRFSAPVRKLSVRHPDGTHAVLTFRQPRRQVPIGVLSSGATAAGTALVAATTRLWEKLPQPVRVTWFPAGPDPQVLVRPAPKTSIVPSGPIVLTFSRPIAAVLGDERPALRPKTPGTWREPDDHTLVFDPSGLGYPLGKSIHVVFPRAIQVIAGSDPAAVRTLSWSVPGGSTSRLKELLADQGYLPFTWTSSGAEVPLTLGAQAAAAVDPPDGTLAWRYAKTPNALKALWNSPTERPVLLQGAIMAFESRHGMPLYPYATRALWRVLLRDEVAGRKATSGYSYVFVTETLPETLTLWHNGHIVLRTSVNTGISSRPTALGTYPVYLHLTETTMQGTNPDGTHYDDPGVPWVNYFHGGDAVHGFIRPGYGYPQSLGCVEAPPTTAGQIFPYVNVGTLVTVAPPTATAT